MSKKRKRELTVVAIIGLTSSIFGFWVDPFLGIAFLIIWCFCIEAL